MLAALLLIAFAAITPRPEYNGGLGHDGMQYAQMVIDLRHGEREGERVPLKSLAAYRLLPVGLVAASGLDPRDGFLALDVAALLGSALLLLAHLERLHVPRAIGLVGVGWWLLLPFGARWAFHDAVLPEALGTFFLLALTLLALQGKILLFALVMALAVLTRENLVALIPFLVLAERSRVGSRQALIGGALVSVTAGAALAAARLWAPISVDVDVPLVREALRNTLMTLKNVNDDPLRLLAAMFFDFGIIPGVLAAAPLATFAFFRRTPAWVYFALYTLVLAVVGGADHDRYLVALGLPLTLAACDARLRTMGPATIALLTVLHIGAVRALWPIGLDWASTAAHIPAAMSMERLGFVALWTLAFMGAAYVVARRSKRRPSE